VTEEVAPIPRNIYGVTKVAAEGLCQLFFREHRLPVIVLRTSRFFPEADDDDAISASYEIANVQANELLYRRVDIEDVVSAHLLAVEKAQHRLRALRHFRGHAVRSGQSRGSQPKRSGSCPSAVSGMCGALWRARVASLPAH
jgi:nucleoside-diphosphate-sugar epimerase